MCRKCDNQTIYYKYSLYDTKDRLFREGKHLVARFHRKWWLDFYKNNLDRWELVRKAFR